MNFDRFGVEIVQIRIDCLDDIANALSSLIRVNDATMVETFALNERKEVVIERQENPVVLDGERELFPVPRSVSPSRSCWRAVWTSQPR